MGGVREGGHPSRRRDRCAAVPGSAAALKLWIDFGPLGIKRSSAQIVARYRLEELVGRQVVAVVNFPPKQIGPFVSEVLVLGAYDERGDVILLKPDTAVEPGARIG